MAATRHEVPIQPYQPELSDYVVRRPFRVMADPA
jgi:hypothetical protein